MENSIRKGCCVQHEYMEELENRFNSLTANCDEVIQTTEEVTIHLKEISDDIINYIRSTDLPSEKAEKIIQYISRVV